MRFLMINLFFVCLLLFGIGYLAFGHDETDAQDHASQTAPDDQDQILSRHMEKFYQLISTDPEAARQELETYAAKSFWGHPLTEEWIELFFRMGSEGAAAVSDVTRFLEMTK